MLSRLPSTATPSALPICNAVLLVAEPTPASSTDTEPMTDSVHGAIASPVPMPSRKKAGSTFAYVECIVTAESRARPSVIRAMPPKTTTLVPTARTRKLESDATTSSTAAIGAIRTPVCRAV